MAEVQRPTLRSRRLGMELRKMREALGYSTHAAGRLLNRTQSSLSKLETGHRGIRIPALLQILDAYGVKDPKRRDDLIRLAKEARKTGWWQSYEMLSPEDMDLIGVEAEATEICYFELILIPGLLQTEGYARALMMQGAFANNPELLDRSVTVRMRRQAILQRPDPPTVRVVVDEAALLRQVGGGAVMQWQLKHLLEVSRFPHVTLQVLPFSAGSYRGMTGHFQAVSAPDLQVVAIDTLTGMSYVEDREEIRTHVETFDRLTGIALPEHESQVLIEQLISSS
jgi:transcriptional regulator with XRE-family HTH domain